MDTEKNNLDNIIKSALGTNKSKLDFQAWKQNNQPEIEQFRSRQISQSPLRAILTNRFTKAASAAVILIAAGLFVQMLDLNHNSPIPVTSPAAMISRLQLNRAYAQGGMDAVDNQYKKAYEKLGPRTGEISMNSLYNEL